MSAFIILKCDVYRKKMNNCTHKYEKMENTMEITLFLSDDIKSHSDAVNDASA